MNDYIHVNPTLQKTTKKLLSRAGFELASAWKHIHTLDDYIDVRVIAQNPTIYNMTEGLCFPTGGYIFFMVRHGRANFCQFSPTNV